MLSLPQLELNNSTFTLDRLDHEFLLLLLLSLLLPWLQEIDTSILLLLFYCFHLEGSRGDIALDFNIVDLGRCPCSGLDGERECSRRDQVAGAAGGLLFEGRCRGILPSSLFYSE